MEEGAEKIAEKLAEKKMSNESRHTNRTNKSIQNNKVKLHKKISSLKHIRILTRKDDDLISMSSMPSEKTISMDALEAKKLSEL